MIIRIALVLFLLAAVLGTTTACAPKEPPTDWKGISDYLKQHQ